MHGRSELLPLLFTLKSLPVRLISTGNGTREEIGASRSSSLAHIMLTFDRFSRVTGVVRRAIFKVAVLLNDDREEEEEEAEREEFESKDGNVLLRRSTGLAGKSSSTVLGRGAAPMIL